MKTSQVIASLSLVGWLALYWIISLNGGFMTGFGPSGPGDPNGPHQINWNQVRMDVAVSFACFIPILALWTPSRLLLGFGAVILVPVAILGLFLLTIPPLGVAILGTVFVWYCAALLRWGGLSHTGYPNNRSPERVVRRDGILDRLIVFLKSKI